jgi:hypothetical protein
MTSSSPASKTALLLGVVALACSGEGNTGQRPISFDLVSQVPWTNGAPPVHDGTGKLVQAAEPVFPPIGDNTLDPGSRPIDCSGLADIEISPYWVETFEADPGIQNGIGVAQAWSAYDDGTQGSFRVPGDVGWYPGFVQNGMFRYDVPWGLAADRISGGPSCDGQPNDWAFHFRGGRFNFYGAGTAHPLASPRMTPEMPLAEPCPAGSDLCPAGDHTSIGLPALVPDYRQPHTFWDVSAYDGVVFWAHRGPDGASGLLVGLQNKYTSDDLARENQTFCRRIRSCRPDCANGLECRLAGDFNRCVAEGITIDSGLNPALLELLYPRCGPDTCFSPEHYKDLDFDDAQCKPYSFSGMETGHYCYGAEPPPIAAERCGDAFVAPIQLSTDWQLYKLPFSEFRQVGFGKKAPIFDLESLYSIAFQFTVGYADVYVDNVSFYRQR